MLPPCVDQIWLTYFVKLHGHRAINVSVIRGIISQCNSDNLPLRNQLKKLTKGVMLMESYILDCHFRFSLRFIYRFLKKHKQLICAVKYCFQNKLTCGLSNAISITVCPQVFSSGGTCTLLPSFLEVHPNFWGCNLNPYSSFGGTKKMNCIFSTQGRAPCCFL